MERFFAIIIISLSLVISGCVSNNLNLIEHPENYQDKSITITAQPYPAYHNGLNLNYMVSEANEEGEPVGIHVNYDNFNCLICEITGNVKKSPEVCTCEIMLKDSNWFTLLPNTPIEKCTDKDYVDEITPVCKDCAEGKPTRCKTGSEKYVYYIDVTSVKTIRSY